MALHAGLPILAALRRSASRSAAPSVVAVLSAATAGKQAATVKEKRRRVICIINVLSQALTARLGRIIARRIRRSDSKPVFTLPKSTATNYRLAALGAAPIVLAVAAGAGRR